MYVKQILGSANHDLFYTDSNVKVLFFKILLVISPIKY